MQTIQASTVVGSRNSKPTMLGNGMKSVLQTPGPMMHVLQMFFNFQEQASKTVLGMLDNIRRTCIRDLLYVSELLHQFVAL